MAAGYGYPLYYDTLFADLREAFNEARILLGSHQVVTGPLTLL